MRHPKCLGPIRLLGPRQQVVSGLTPGNRPG
jgi:hypothetical protein